MKVEENTTTTQPEADPLQHWQAAERAQQQVVINRQVALVKERVTLDKMKGSESPKEALLAIVNEFPKGISLTLVKSTFDTGADLAAARDELVKEGKLTTDEKKRSMTLYPVAQKEEVTTK